LSSASVRNPLPPASHPNPLHCNAVNGSFTINVNQYTTYQALDWLKRANADVRARLRHRLGACFSRAPPQIVAIDQSSTSSGLVESGYKVRTVDTVDLQAVS
jgi:hypothetical protein